jgi:hypothetical protein
LKLQRNRGIRPEIGQYRRTVTLQMGGGVELTVAIPPLYAAAVAVAGSELPASNLNGILVRREPLDSHDLTAGTLWHRGHVWSQFS